eukprot:3588419-Pleurochrysis_carterae.AAC.1
MSAAALSPVVCPHLPTATCPSYDPARSSRLNGRRPPSSLTAAPISTSAAITASTSAPISSRTS